MAKPKDVSQLSDAQRKQLSRQGYITADGTRYALDKRTGKFFTTDGRAPAGTIVQKGNTRMIQPKRQVETLSTPGAGYRPDKDVYITPEDQNRYQEHKTPDDFLGMLDLYEKRKKRGWS